jgi:hypothetical protein
LFILKSIAKKSAGAHSNVTRNVHWVRGRGVS